MSSIIASLFGTAWKMHIEHRFDVQWLCSTCMLAPRRSVVNCTCTHKATSRLSCRGDGGHIMYSKDTKLCVHAFLNIARLLIREGTLRALTVSSTVSK